MIATRAGENHVKVSLRILLSKAQLQSFIYIAGAQIEHGIHLLLLFGLSQKRRSPRADLLIVRAVDQHTKDGFIAWILLKHGLVDSRECTNGVRLGVPIFMQQQLWINSAHRVGDVHVFSKLQLHLRPHSLEQLPIICTPPHEHHHEVWSHHRPWSTHRCHLPIEACGTQLSCPQLECLVSGARTYDNTARRTTTRPFAIKLICHDARKRLLLNHALLKHSINNG
mmetsp:Transcript_19331/g.48287  ORF Transcript_19331/g.48287 Transcript_19331/m.48287 type:complete len:225 (+) Transcript_19331:188-862(+)